MIDAWDLVGLAAFGLLVAGAWYLWGLGGAMLGAGAPLGIAYFLRELRLLRR